MNFIVEDDIILYLKNTLTNCNITINIKKSIIVPLKINSRQCIMLIVFYIIYFINSYFNQY